MACGGVESYLSPTTGYTWGLEEFFNSQATRPATTVKPGLSIPGQLV